MEHGLLVIFSASLRKLLGQAIQENGSLIIKELQNFKKKN